MKRAMLAGLAFVAFAGAALAADPERVITPGPFDPPPAYPKTVTPGPPSATTPAYPATVTPGLFDPPPAYSMAKVYNWTGFYVGVNGGGGFAHENWFSVPDGFGGSFNISGGLVGGTAGYNLQTGDPFVVGVEADLDWAGMKGTAFVNGTTNGMCMSASGVEVGCDFRAPWLGTARVRLGWAFNGILPYVTGGGAVGLLQTRVVGAPFGTEQTNNFGWTAGAGIEFAITDALRAKVEYLHIDLDSVIGFPCNAACSNIGAGPLSFTHPNIDIVRAGLNYRLWQY